MPAPKLIGVASEASWYGLPYGVLVTAATWAAQGYRVLVVDAEPAGLALTSLATRSRRGATTPRSWSFCGIAGCGRGRWT